MGELDEQLNDKMGIEIIDWNPDRVVATMPVKGNRQPYGLMHGGANAVLAEAVGSVCAALKSGMQPTVGLELSCTHHRGVREGLVTAVATPLHVGRSTVTVDIVITDESDRRTCTARLTCMVLQSAPGS
ncbi:PaaI family thioesterase [Kibdelosporangium persicum]|uniref:Aromatic compounds degradation protein paaI n=1 Tax=Kibdelosporangium persicum TaxID=2698649 RepID=A0ABX2FD01_9PSEU|nr:PaaI family thioesterase [Kibdelosporangium persicum]NRN69250.1 Aromatic compounds degradation protein paaI [Kibdelosporangium persicum]